MGRDSVHYEPTKEWIRSRNPVGKKEILAHYERERRVLDLRLSGPVKRKFTAYVIELEDGVEKRRSKAPKEFIIECWKISEQDHATYKRLLDDWFERAKKEHNQKVLEKRRKKDASPTV